MKKTLMLVMSSIFGMLMITACNSGSGPVIPSPTFSLTLQATVEIKSMPTPMSPVQMIVYDDLQVVMSEAEITTNYLTEYGSSREPPAGKKIVSEGETGKGF